MSASRPQQPTVRLDAVADTPPAPAGDDSPASPERVAEVLELIRPMIQADGGDVELIAVGDDGVVQIRLLGACIGCPSAAITLQSGIERNLKAHIPSITAVKAID